MNTNTTTVGTITIDADQTHTRSISETASRYETVSLTPGTYEVHAAHDHLYADTVVLHAEVPGIVTSRYDGSEYFGVAIGNSPQYDRHPDVGKARTVKLTVHLGGFTLNETAGEVLSLLWITGLRNRGADKLNGHGLSVEAHSTLKWRDLVTNVSYACQIPRQLIEFFDDPYSLAERVNTAVDNDDEVNVWRVHCDRNTRTVLKLYPLYDHVPYTERRDLRSARRR